MRPRSCCARGCRREAAHPVADRHSPLSSLVVALPACRGWITWGPCVGETKEGRLARQRRMLEGEWRESLHPDGRVFFYHTTTHERRWEPPAEGLYARRRYALVQYFEAQKQAAAVSDGKDGKPQPQLK